MPKIESVKNAIRYGKRDYLSNREIDLFGRTAFAYVVLDPQRKGRETSKLLLETFDEKEQHNEKEMDYSLMKKGVMILISSENISRQEIVSLYYLRQTAENLFGFSKADLNLLPLRVHSEETLRGFC